MASAPSTSDTPQREFKLFEDYELRIEVNQKEEDFSVELVEGRAEIFGAELEQHKKYNFPPGARFAVFSYMGCTVEVCGRTESAYIAEQTPMIIYLNTHAALEQCRVEVELDQKMVKEQGRTPSGRVGPKIMLVGPTDVGKSTVARILCNYAVRMGRTPLLVDLDVGQNAVSVPGSIGAMSIDRTAHVVDGFERPTKSIVFHFGGLSPSHNMVLYERQMQKLAESVSALMAQDEESHHSGCVINTCGWVKGDGYTCIRKAAEIFEVDVVVVFDHERLYKQLQDDIPTFVKILHQPKSGGVEVRPPEVRQHSRKQAIHKYFYGVPSCPYDPFTFELAADQVIFVKIGAEPLPESCLPIGMRLEDHNTNIVPVPFSALLRHRVASITGLENLQTPEMALRPCLGFVVVTDVNVEERTLTILSTHDKLPGKILVLGDVTFVDDQTKRE